jgi:hypothetical protein
MQYNQDPTKHTDTFGAGKHGWTEGNGASPRSLVRASHMNALFRELLAAIEGGGLTPDAGDLTQLNTVLAAMRTVSTSLGNSLTALSLEVDALQEPPCAQYEITGTAPVGGDFDFSAVLTRGSWSLPTSDTIQVPSAGLYMVTVSGAFTSTDAANPTPLELMLMRNAGASYQMRAQRFSTGTSDYVRIGGTFLISITTPASHTLNLRNDSPLANTLGIVAAEDPAITLVKIGSWAS